MAVTVGRNGDKSLSDLVNNALEGGEEGGVEVSQQVHDTAAPPQRGWGSDRSRLARSASMWARVCREEEEMYNQPRPLIASVNE